MNVTNMSKIIRTYFRETANRKATETGFVRRKSKISGSTFLMTLVFGLLDSAQSSLNDLVLFCQDHFGISVTPQGLDERIHDKALIFMKELFCVAIAVFRQTANLPLSLLTQFSAVNITDSTAVSLPETLCEEFPGCGGSASKAGLKIQLVFDFLRGCFKTIMITDGITPDQKFTTHIDLAEPNSLNLSDLGYFAIRHLKGFCDKGAYFLCRLLPRTNLYEKNGQKLDMNRLLKNETRKFFETDILIDRIPCRVCFFRASEEVANRRRQKSYKNSSKKGRTPGKQTSMLMGWTIFITNVPSPMLSLRHIAFIYSVRWQIELIFKLWKSHMKVHMISGFRKERIMVELYAKLIGVVFFQFLFVPLSSTDIDLSPVKSFKLLKKKVGMLADTFGVCANANLKKAIEKILSVFPTHAKREKRRKRLSTYQQLHQIGVSDA